MGTSLHFQPFVPSMLPNTVQLWNNTIGEHFPMTEILLHQVTARNPSFQPTDALTVWDQNDIVGFGLLNRFRGTEEVYRPLAQRVHISSIIVAPKWQRQGLGTEIYQRLTTTVADVPSTRIQPGAGAFHLFPGIPENLPVARSFFESLGFVLDQRVCDVRVDISTYKLDPTIPALLQQYDLTAGPASRDDWDQLLPFLSSEFSANWRYGADCFLKMGGDPSDWFLVKQRDRIVGFSRTHHPGFGPIGPPRYWSALRGERAGGLGPIGLANQFRGRGLGLALLHLTLDRLQTLGVDDVIADWTHLIDFYARVGMQPWKCYLMGHQ